MHSETHSGRGDEADASAAAEQRTNGADRIPDTGAADGWSNPADVIGGRTPNADAAVAQALDAELGEALDLLSEGIDRLLEIGDRGDLCALGPARLIAFAQDLEARRTRLLAVDTLVIEAADAEALGDYTCSRSLPLALADVLRISRATARARVARAKQLMPRDTFSDTSSAQLPALAEAVRQGSVSCDQAAVIGAGLRTLAKNPQVEFEDLQRAEQMLLEQASSMGADDLKVMVAKIDDVLLPDGRQPRDDVAAARRGIVVGPERRDGTHGISGSLTRSAYARLMSVLSPLAAPRPAEDDLGPDPRTAEQRMHDALDDALSRLLDTSGLPRSGGTPATVHVVIDLDRLQDLLAETDNARDDVTRDRAHNATAGTTSFGDKITFGDLIRLAEQARIIPTYLSATQGIMAYGASRRCATEAQTQALITRDRGCSFPGCDAPPEWCERHHVIPWYRGGPTDLNNLTLVCGYHHREFENRGWRVVIHDGLPTWIPPTWIDRDQKPLRNVRIRPPGPDPLDLDIRAFFASDAANGPAPSEDLDDLDALDPLDDLIELLALHITDEEREEFKYDLDVVLGSYLGPNAPANQYLQPVA